MHLDDDACYRALQSRDARFDGWFVVAVRTTHVYCRPSCPARTPARANVEFLPTAASAQVRGYRACKRCRPDASPGSPAWDQRGDVVGRALALLRDGVVDRDGVAGLASRLGYSERHLHRLLVAELGTGAAHLARAQRAETARTLIERTDLPMTEVAFAAGFASVRQFNDVVRLVFATNPTELRRRHGRRRVGGDATPGPSWIRLRLPHRRPLHAEHLWGFLATRALPGVEAVQDAGATFARSLALPHGGAVVRLRAEPGWVGADLRLDDLRDLAPAVARCRRLLDLDADPVTVDDHLGADEVLGPHVAARPGLRSPGATDGGEQALRAVLGQQVTVAGARTLAGRLVALLGERLADPVGAVTHHVPSVAALVDAGPDAIAGIGLPARRARAVHSLAAAMADGRLCLDHGADRQAAVTALREVDGIGPWTAAYVAMRALGDPDVALPGDAGIRRALAAHGLDDGDAERWRPWRSYATHHLWAATTPP